MNCNYGRGDYMSKDKYEELEHRIKLLEEEMLTLKEEKRPSPNVYNENKHQVPSPFRENAEIYEQEKEEVDWEKRIGQVWLPRIFVFVLLIGILWAFKAAIDHSLVTEQVRVVIGFLVGSSMLWWGHKQIHSTRKNLGFTLVGGAISVFILSTFSAHVLFGFISMHIALIMHITWIALGIHYTYKHKSQELGIFIALSGYLVPFLLEHSTLNIYVFVTYIFILYMSFFVLSLKENYLKLFYVSIVLLHFTYFAYATLFGLGNHPANAVLLNVQIIAISVIVHHIILMCVYSKLVNMHKSVFPLLITSVTLTLAWCYAAFNAALVTVNDYTYIDRSLKFLSSYDVVLIGLLVAYLSISTFLFKKKQFSPLPLFSSVSVLLATFLLMRVFQFEEYNVIFVCESVLVYYIATLVNSNFQRCFAFVLLTLGALPTIVLAFGATEVFSIKFAHYLILILALTLWYRLFKYKDTQTSEDFKRFGINFFGASLIGTLLVFFSLIAQISLIPYDYSVERMGVSIVWGLFSIASVFYGLKCNNKKIRVFGIVLIFMTLLKLIFFDIQFISVVVRALLFISLGAIGILMSRLFYNKNDN